MAKKESEVNARPAGGGGGGTGGPPPAAFVRKLVTDAKNVPAEEPVVLTGYPGESSEPDHTRIYCGPTLDHYADVPTDEILHWEAADEPGAPKGNVVVWVNKNAQVRQGVRGQSAAGPSSFFEGPVAANYARRGGGAGGPGRTDTALRAGGPAPTQPGACVPITMFMCPTIQCIPHSHPLIGCTAYLHCPQPGLIGPTGVHFCTVATTCTQIGCPQTDAFGCPRTSTCPPTYQPGCGGGG